MRQPVPARPQRRAPRSGGARRWRRTAAVAALALTAAGCGVRGTSVPVDAGGAPSRVSCKVPEVDAPTAPGDVQVTVYLVCSSTLTPVERTVSRPKAPTDGARLQAARALLSELQKQPVTAEEEAGFSSAVPEDVEVTGPRTGDAADALRLSVRPDDLPSFALAQLVCSYGMSAALGRTHAVLLGGPGGDASHRYECSDEVLTHPDIAQNTSWGGPLSRKG